jgi:hypothetical protein
MKMIDVVDLKIDYKQICQKVTSNKDLWINRFGIFYTFGASVYIDDNKDYIKHKNKLNNVLYEHFGDLYSKLADYFGAELNGEIGYPGFHIFNESSNQTTASIHFDTPYLRLPNYKLSFSKPQSFTILLKKPRSGAGLNVWNKINLNKMEVMEQKKFMEHKTIKDLGDVEHVEYELGKMYVHSGSVLHQISNNGIGKGEERITLQGHIIQDGDKKYMYF